MKIESTSPVELYSDVKKNEITKFADELFEIVLN